jgi:hypothetical protein
MRDYSPPSSSSAALHYHDHSRGEKRKRKSSSPQPPLHASRTDTNRQSAVLSESSTMRGSYSAEQAAAAQRFSYEARYWPEQRSSPPPQRLHSAEATAPPERRVGPNSRKYPELNNTASVPVSSRDGVTATPYHDRTAAAAIVASSSTAAARRKAKPYGPGLGRYASKVR